MDHQRSLRVVPYPNNLLSSCQLVLQEKKQGVEELRSEKGENYGVKNGEDPNPEQ